MNYIMIIPAIGITIFLAKQYKRGNIITAGIIRLIIKLITRRF